ncbi:MAG TPA: transglycosylase SLT domain-containing protein, partial [Alphaproteobacteria bacterium]|nr:transglycosylase SLT domain-containing protein [Alphaproteobacteria bacterium]
MKAARHLLASLILNLAVLHGTAAAGLGTGANPLAAKPLPEQDCRTITRQAEQRHDIPAHLLAAISLAEASRWDADHQAGIAWPWTVYAEGRGRYLPSKAAAIAEVRRLKAAGVRNIDVGCMQVNLKYHPDAFASLGEAFDPERNADYAARFLKDLEREHRSWSQAVAFYHSATRELSRPYRLKVMQFWHDERLRAYKLRRAENLARVRARRARFR